MTQIGVYSGHLVGNGIFAARVSPFDVGGCLKDSLNRACT